MTDKRMTAKCPDCGCLEGQLHELGCDVESCPFCGRQLISCDCQYEKLNLFDADKYTQETGYLPQEIYEKGLSNSQWNQWKKLLNSRGRVPYIEYPTICVKCGRLYPELFQAPTEEWNHYIQQHMRRNVVCKECYNFIKNVIDKSKQERIEHGEQAKT